ncbi:MAG: hypothetical protein U9R38_03805 [Candidatus Margulisiibacteriota bacterium]|nr:hypothetical protein [Candidatus Margulisiibacteriota bacterium]
MKFRYVFFSLLSVLVLSLAFCGCSATSGGSNPEANHGTYTYLGTQSPGDVWSWVIGTGTFTGTNETTSMTYEGTFVSLASGFLKATITSANDPNVPTDGTAVFYCLEFPNTMLLVGSGGVNENPIICAAKAASAPSAGQYNWLNIPTSGWSPGDTSYGSTEVTVDTVNNLFDFYVSTYDISGNLEEIITYEGFSFSEGRMAKSGETLQIFMTPSGLFMGDNGPGNGGLVGAAKQTIDMADVASKNYRGVMYEFDAATGDASVDPIGGEPHPTVSGAIRGFAYSDLDNNTIDSSDYATLTFSGQDADGIVAGAMATSSHTYDFKMVVSQVNNKYIVMGIAVVAGSNPLYFLIVEI